MRVTARCDQAVREAAELAARRRPATGELAVLEAVTLADLAAGRLPDAVRALTWGVAGA